MISQRLIAILGSLILSAAGSQALADWELDSSNSSLHYVTSKNAAISELNSFGELSGNITDDGEARLVIELASVDTNIDIRDQRMREILFDVDNNPRAVATLSVDRNPIRGLQPGSSRSGDYEVMLNLHGVEQAIPVNLRIERLSNNRLQVEPAEPLILNANTFNLGAGVEELREIAGLDSINPNIVVDFQLTFNQVGASGRRAD